MGARVVRSHRRGAHEQRTNERRLVREARRIFFSSVWQFRAQFYLRRRKFRLAVSLSQFRSLRSFATRGARFPQHHGRVAFVWKLDRSVDARVGSHLGERDGRRVAFIRQLEPWWRGGNVSRLWELWTS